MDAGKNGLYESYLTAIATAYINHDFGGIYRFFDEQIIWESSWVLEPRRGRDTVIEYYERKAQQLKGSPWKTYHTLVKTLDPFSAPIKPGKHETLFLVHAAGKLMDYVLQISDTGEKSDMVIDIEINDENLISRIDICFSSLYKFEFYRRIN